MRQLPNLFKGTLFRFTQNMLSVVKNGAFLLETFFKGFPPVH